MDSASWSLWSLITPIWGFAILLSAVDFTQMLSLKMWGSGAENTYILFLKQYKFLPPFPLFFLPDLVIQIISIHVGKIKSLKSFVCSSLVFIISDFNKSLDLRFKNPCKLFLSCSDENTDPLRCILRHR